MTLDSGDSTVVFNNPRRILNPPLPVPHFDNQFARPRFWKQPIRPHRKVELILLAYLSLPNKVPKKSTRWLCQANEGPGLQQVHNEFQMHVKFLSC